MNHPASTAATVLLGLAALVGGAAWILSGSDDDAGQGATLPPVAASDTVGFVAVTPKEQKKKLNMERTQREFKQIREIGEEVAPDLYMIPDANGDPTYYSTELFKGRGRNGEPLFMSVQMKKTRTLPLKDPKKYISPEPAKFKPTPVEGVLKGGKPDKSDQTGNKGGTGGAQTPSDSTGDSGDGSSKTDKDG
jgi:hypothetical protein